jgi:cellulose synthase/poly-beta-1,6-N-acetylglucosamine synthase-like glycosyltransferase
MITILLMFYSIAAGLLVLYGLNCHIMTYLFQRRVKQRSKEDRDVLERFYRECGRHDLPIVTSQLPVYNEMNVVERIIDAVAAFDYPDGKHEIQVLDDSTDETSQLIAAKIAVLKAKGVQIEHIRRPTREGFKAGALKYGLEKAKGEYVAIFDADFVPPRDFLLKSVPFLVLDPQLGAVQGRWDHLNGSESLITCLQSICLNGHFVIEQSARNWNNLFMGFNGTAGVLRKQAILAAGNWQADTLTEDLELSYRMQLSGWKFRYLLNLVAPAEVPTTIQALKSQQFRWTKGSVQTAMKLLPSLWKSDYHFFQKLQAVLHLSHHLMYPLMVYLAMIAPLPLIPRGGEMPPLLSVLMGLLFLLSFLGPFRLYWTAETYIHRGWTRRIFFLPLLACIGCGLSINNTRAVFQALRTKKTEFVRTPKKGDRPQKQYQSTLNPFYLCEIAFGLWCLVGTLFYFIGHHYVTSYFLLLYTIGFLGVGGLSCFQQFTHLTESSR